MSENEKVEPTIADKTPEETERDRYLAEHKSASIQREIFLHDHPVIRVSCDDAGFLFFERENAPPLPMPAATPGESRKEMLKRCVALLEATVDKNGHPLPSRFQPISSGGKLTVEQLKLQVHDAVILSRERERKFNDKVKQSISMRRK